MSHTAVGGPRAQTEAWVRWAITLLSSGADIRRVGLALVEGGGRRLSFTASDRGGDVADWCQVDAYDDVPLNSSIRTGKLVTGSLESLAGRYPEFVARQDVETRALATVPVVAAGQVMGGFVLFYGTDQRFDAAQLSRLERLGEELGEHLSACLRPQGLPRRSIADEPVPVGARVATHLAADEYAAVGTARRFVRETLLEWRVGEAAADTATLCVSELVTNAIIHAAGGCELRLVLLDDTLTISVRDGGTGTPGSRTASDALDSHGRGLELVEMLTTRWGSQLDEVGTTVWCELDLT